MMYLRLTNYNWGHYGMRRLDAVELDDVCPREVLQRHAHLRWWLCANLTVQMSALKVAYV